MKKVMKKYVAWAFSGLIISLLAMTSITLRAAPPTYELNGNDKVKEHCEQLFRGTRDFLPLDTAEDPHESRRSLTGGLVYMATYDEQLEDDTIHYLLQSLANDRISIIYQGDNNTTIGWSSPVFMIQIPSKNIELMPMSIKKVLKVLYELDTDDITEKMLLEKGVGTIKIRVCGMGRSKNYVLSEPVHGPFNIAPHGIRWIEHNDLPVLVKGDGFFVDKYDIKKCKESIWLGMFDAHGVKPAKDSQLKENAMKLIPYGICKYDRYTSHAFEYFISPPMTLEFIENAEIGSYFITAVNSSKRAIVITYVIQSENPEIMETIGRTMSIYGLPAAYYFIEKAKFNTKDKVLDYRLKKAIDTLIGITESRTSPL